MSKTIGAVVSDQTYTLLEEEMVRKGYLSISETIRVILREYFSSKEIENEIKANSAKQPQEPIQS